MGFQETCWAEAQADFVRRGKRPSKVKHDRERWSRRYLLQLAKRSHQRRARDLLPIPLVVAHLSNFTVDHFCQPLLFADTGRAVSDQPTSSQMVALHELSKSMSSVCRLEPTDAAVLVAFRNIGRCADGDHYHRRKEALISQQNADPELVDLLGKAGPGCDILGLGIDSLQSYAHPSDRMDLAVSFTSAAAGPGYLGFMRGRLKRLYQRMRAGGLLAAFAIMVPVCGGVFAVAKASETTLRIISDLRRAGSLLVKPHKVKLLTPVVLAIFLRGAIRRRRLAGCSSRLGIVTAKRDVSKYYHRLRMPFLWSYLFALPRVKLGAVRSWLKGLPLLRGAGPSEDVQGFWKDARLSEVVDPKEMPDSTVVYPLPSTLPMGLPDRSSMNL